MNTYAVVGLGYVGLGLAIALNEKHTVLGYDLDTSRVSELKQHLDRHGQFETKILAKTSIHFTDKITDIKQADFFIVAVPTPAYFYSYPNLDPLVSAVKQIATIIKPDDTIVFESSVYPGTTDEVCIPLLEEISGLKSGKDFYVGYSPERINPGDKYYHLKNITKIISGQNETALKRIHATYASICDKVYPVSSMKVAEAIKILENTQRDVNIALMNEYTQIMHALQLNMHEILEGAKTKWSFVPFKPGLVGGHCISIDSLYLAFKAKRVAVDPELILCARKINDNMTQFIIHSMNQLLLASAQSVDRLTVGILGVTYKENVNDTRNSLSLKLIKELKANGIHCRVHDPMDHHLTHFNPEVKLESFEELHDLSVIILTVGHDFYKQAGLKKILRMSKGPKIFMDIPNLFVDEAASILDLKYWCL